MDWGYQDANLVGPEAEEPAGLDHFEGLVHERGGVDGDLGTHAPGGMGQGLLGGDVRKFFGRTAVEGSAAGGEGDVVDFGAAAGAEGLEDGGVLAVDGDDFGVVAASQVHNQVAGHDQGFLVGQGEAFAALDGGQSGGEAGGADHGGEDDVGLGQLGQAAAVVDEDFGADEVMELLAEAEGGAVVWDAGVARVKAVGLFGEEIDGLAGGNGQDAKVLAEGGDHFEGGAADGTRRTENDDIGHLKSVSREPGDPANCLV